MEDWKKVYSSFNYFFILQIISKYSEFQNYLQNKEIIIREVSLLKVKLSQKSLN